MRAARRLALPSLYFFSYITLCNVFMLSLLAALVLEVIKLFGSALYVRVGANEATSPQSPPP